jgi:hypothetical protein
MGFEGPAQSRAHRNHPPTAPGLWRPKLPVRVSFRNLDVAAQEIKPVPPKREDLADPHASKHHTGVTSHGTFVRVLKPAVEGLLAQGQQGADVGDKLRVKLIRTDIRRGYIDFVRD